MARDAAASKSRHLVKHFARGAGPVPRRGTRVTAVDDVSFSIDEGETFGLVGESGSGKTTTGRCLLRLVEPTSGAVAFRGENVLAFSQRAPARGAAATCRSSFRIRIRRSTRGCGPARSSRSRSSSTGSAPRSARRDRVAELFRLVGLDPAHLERYPHQFSGGQRQRIGLARALALEPVVPHPRRAGLGARRLGAGAGRQPADGSAGAAAAHLPVHRARSAAGRAHLQPRRGDVPGEDRRDGPTAALFAAPQHPYTRALLSAIPVPDPGAPRQRIVLDPGVGRPRARRCAKWQRATSRRSDRASTTLAEIHDDHEDENLLLRSS